MFRNRGYEGEDQVDGSISMNITVVKDHKQVEFTSRRPRKHFIGLSVSFAITVVIVGSVVWKVTKDTYQENKPVVKCPDVCNNITASDCVSDGGKSDGGDGNKGDGNKGDGNKGDDGDGNKGDGGTGDNKEPTEEDIRRHPWKSLRLPRTIQPVHYDITLFPDFYDGHGEFYGNETIELEITSPSQYLLIHVRPDYMNITDTKVYDNSTNEQLRVNRTFMYPPNEFLVIEAEGTFQNVVRVALSFEGSLTKGIIGLYKSSYFNSNTKETRYLATSKFEPIFARQAFPCLDEPNMKATFTITLIHNPSYFALSNMDVDTKTAINSNFNATKFHRSVKMSTYLVCFIVCDFDSYSGESTTGVPIRVFATPDKLSQTSYALKIAKSTLDLYTDLFNMSYPLPKLDLIAVPDFSSGAMEQWGLITFRESRLLYGIDESTLASKKTVAKVVSHEIAHMWFGNVVTMDWWNDLWLNEGFASYMEYIGVANSEPGWDMESQFLLEDELMVMHQDAVLSSHPIIVNVQDPAEVNAVFDTISYSKGASVIRMLKSIMGSEKFFEGIKHYLKEYKWGNAKTDDLWKSLEQVNGSIPVKKIMDTWTTQDGFPYITITTGSSVTNITTVDARQQRFMSNPDANVDPKNSAYGYNWYVSLDYNTSAGISDTIVLNGSDERFHVDLNLAQDNTWIKFNKDKNGFYRVLYPNHLWDQLTKYLKSTMPDHWTLSPADRADILSDAFNFAAVKKISYSVPLNLISYLSHEKHYVPWNTAIRDGLSYIDQMLNEHPDYGTWKEYRRTLVNSSLEELGFKDENSHSQLRALLYDLASNDGNKMALDNLKQAFRKWLDENVEPDINLRAVIYKDGMKFFGTDEDWATIWEQYLTETSPSMQHLLLESLASTRQPHLIAKLLDYATKEEGIREQDFFTVISLLGWNQFARPIVWTWMRRTYTQLEQRFTTIDRKFGQMAYDLVRHFKTSVQLQEVKYFFSQHPDEGSSNRYRKMALETINSNIYWINNFRDDILCWIKDNRNRNSN